MAKNNKKFDYAKGKYYFVVNNSITINRSEKKEAVYAYSNYLNSIKKNVSWLGKWDGKKFTEDNFEALTKKK